VQQRIEALRVALGDVLAAGELEQLAGAVDDWQAHAGEALVAEGHQAPQGFVVMEGTATVWVGSDPVARLGPGSWVWGDASRGARLSPASVVADSAMWLLVLAPTESAAVRRHLEAGAADRSAPAHRSPLPRRM